MELAAAAAPPVTDGLDPRLAAACLEAERLARQIVLDAHDDAERELKAATAEAAARVAELVGDAQAELRKIPPPPDPDLAAAGVRAETAARCAAILERASAHAADVLRVAESEAVAIDTETRRRRAALDKELLQLVRQREREVRALEAQVVSVRAAGAVAGSGVTRRLPRLAIVAGIVVVTAALAGAAGWALSSALSSPAAVPIVDPPAPTTGVLSASLCPIPSRYRSVFVAAARREQVPLSLLTSVAAVESRWQPTQVSKRGAVGLMQLLRSTATYLHVNPYNWRQNVLGGARFLRLMLAQYHGNTELALAAYNAGPYQVSQGSVPLETVAYVGAVMAQQAVIVGCR
ncbi:MAG TPA: lytic transglycosylase domain-containing protein [Gaiellaceae bacterium]|nr:lytic transglycosylase domain-containing protein [Gaiellaceae bacterium]